VTTVPAWTRGEIERFLERERLAYQRIELPHGLATPGESRAGMCDVIFRDVAGKSVLDVGSYLGYFCQEALRRGAVSAHGIEVDANKVRQARALAEMNGLAVSFQHADIESCALPGTYDVVLCLNVVHHLFDPIGVIRRLARAAREKLVLEVASLDPRDARKLGLGFFARRVVTRLPILYLASGVGSTAVRTNAQKFFFTPHAVLHLLRDHTKLFSAVEVMPSGFKGRFIAIAKRREISRLLVVSGPTAAGKTTFLEQLSAGTLPAAIRSQLPPDCERWPLLRAASIGSEALHAIDGTRLDVPRLDGLVLEYDTMRPIETATHTFERDSALDFMECAHETTVVSLQPSPERLLRQHRASEEAAARSGAKRRPALRRHREQLLEDYANTAFVEAEQAKWASYLSARHPGARVIAPRWPA